MIKRCGVELDELHVLGDGLGAVAHGEKPNFLITEAMRGFGAILRLPSGEVQRRQKLGERSLAGYVIKIARRYRTG